MGINAAVIEEGRAGDRGVEAEVIELLPQAGYKVRLATEEIVIAHAGSAGVVNFMRLRPGDRVRVELAQRDKTRGRIIALVNTSA